MEANNVKAMREALAAALPIMRNCPFTHYDDVGVDEVADAMESALAAPPRACDVMSKEDLTKVVTNALRHSLAKTPEFTWAESLVEAVVASAIKCAYDTQLASKEEEGSDASK